jgi:hypothetical protein
MATVMWNLQAKWHPHQRERKDGQRLAQVRDEIGRLTGICSHAIIAGHHRMEHGENLLAIINDDPRSRLCLLLLSLSLPAIAPRPTTPGSSPVRA